MTYLGGALGLAVWQFAATLPCPGQVAIATLQITIIQPVYKIIPVRLVILMQLRETLVGKREHSFEL